MTRRIRNFVVTGVGLTILFAVLLAVDPRLRDRATQMVVDREFHAVQSTISQAVAMTTGVAGDYAGDNTYMVTFLVAACVLVVLMLKALL